MPPTTDLSGQETDVVAPIPIDVRSVLGSIVTSLADIGIKPRIETPELTVFLVPPKQANFVLEKIIQHGSRPTILNFAFPVASVTFQQGVRPPSEPPALLQLGFTESFAVLVQMDKTQMRSFPRLKSFMQGIHVTKVGTNLASVAGILQSHFGISITSTLDLTNVAASLGFTNPSRQQLARELLALSPQLNEGYDWDTGLSGIDNETVAAAGLDAVLPTRLFSKLVHPPARIPSLDELPSRPKIKSGFHKLMKEHYTNDKLRQRRDDKHITNPSSSPGPSSAADSSVDSTHAVVVPCQNDQQDAIDDSSRKSKRPSESDASNSSGGKASDGNAGHTSTGDAPVSKKKKKKKSAGKSNNPDGDKDDVAVLSELTATTKSKSSTHDVAEPKPKRKSKTKNAQTLSAA
ncbi:uncharacterized protein BJ171DRAFT_486974 [Polychytrium aggregatum]|uniref:uncharacterized protein n=1 Tax=Polychytrium aggregatum TaxID=110093 RepID=UPI0022FDFBC7|nr:uncharacterized protein BJ171DRAFT_486974 [Polychytrium aggregatum]KAI9209424.1 hypothetical protein BJ171DRAFT_486974 [Polychytrium aggregatum]